MLSPSPPGAAADAAAAAAAIAESVDRPTKLADVPDAFFARNEAPFRGMIHPERAAAEYAHVDAAAEALAAAARDGAAGEYELVHDLINNALYFKDAKKKAAGKKKTEAAARRPGGGGGGGGVGGGGDGGVRGGGRPQPEVPPQPLHHGARARRDGAVSRGVRRRDGGGAARAAGTL